MARRPIAVITVITRELAVALGSQGEALFSSELRAAVGRTTDQVFLTEILADAPAGTAPDFAGAVANVLGAVVVNAASRVYLVLAPNVAQGAAALVGSNGMMFPLLGPNGGQVGMVPAVVSDALGPDEIAAIDAAGIAANAGDIVIDAAKSASVQMSDAPTSGPQALVSLWTSNSLGLRAVRAFGFSAIREGCAAKCAITTP